ncbi:MAG: T9SS type A sorting domain-containing protein, partial [Chitinophagales bacterium]
VPNPNDFDCHRFLTVDASGEVILVDYTTTPCQSSSKSAGSEIDLSAQQAQVDALQSQVEELKKEIAEMKAMFSSAPVKSTKMTSSINNVHLSQIAPNPFSQNATISFSLPEDVTDAQLLITDLSGKVLKSYSLHSGATQQVINGNELMAGSYLYSISVNGKVIDSKQMVVTH